MVKPPPTLLQKFLILDTKFSHYLHSKFHTLLPLFFLLILEISADFRFSFPISLSILFTLSLPSLLPFFSSLLLGLLLDLAAVGLIKIVFRRPRPPYNHLSSMSTPVSADHFSFPSGHSSRVSFVASLVFLYKEVIEAAVVEVRDKGGVFGRWVGEGGKLVEVVVVGVCVWAVVTAVSRVLFGRHYFFDVFAGVCLGVIEGVFAFRVLRFEDIFRNLVKVEAKCLGCKAQEMPDQMDLSEFILMPDPHSRAQNKSVSIFWRLKNDGADAKAVQSIYHRWPKNFPAVLDWHVSWFNFR